MMRSVWDNSWFTIPVLVFYIIALALAYQVPYGEEIIHLNAWRDEPFNTLFRLATSLGEPVAFILTGIAALFWRYRFALLIVLTGIVVSPTVYILKDKIGTDRPITFFEKERMRDRLDLVPKEALNSGQTSFPSGHTMAAFALYSVLTLIAGERFRQWGLLFAILSILTGFSRIFLAQHFLADVLGGSILGMFVAWMVWQMNSRMQGKKWRFLDSNLLHVRYHNLDAEP